jgi:hypothetical protein
LLHIQDFHIAAVLLLLLGALVVELAPIDDFRYGRIGIGRYLYQIKFLLGGEIERFCSR